jgi:putative membrane-bound dehydrogenase-like protein
MTFLHARWIWLLLLAQVAPAAQFKFPSQTLSVPDGFEVEQVAGPPLVDRPISASFDEQGRLYVTDSSGSNDKPDKQLKEKPHRVVRLTDQDGDGRFESATVFADKMMFPEGCLWHDGSVYVAAPPSIWKLTDTNHDGVADLRQEWHEGKTLTGCANDLHGPFLGPDGWLYWCKGAFATQTYDRPGRTPFVSRAAHIFRARPDHSGLEAVLTGGMDNPVGVAFTAGGERILCGTFFITHEPGKRDGLIHAIYGGVYGKVNDATDSHKKTGELMPIMTHMGPAAPCSVIRYESRMDGYQDNLFACYFNLRKVSRHVLVEEGATFRTIDSDFVTSDNPDFHPTEVLEDADGSLLVVDTGGWYKICCPTSQLAKPDVLGGIYRVRRVGATKLKDPRGLKLDWSRMRVAGLAKLLGDERPAVSKRAMAGLARQGAKAIEAVADVARESRSVTGRRNAVWTLTRIDDPSARQAVRDVLTDKDSSVCQIALHSVSLWRDAEATDAVIAILRGTNPQLKRVAAEALGRIGDRITDATLVVQSSTALPEAVFRPGDKKVVQELLAASAGKPDRALEHSLIYALIEIDDPKSTLSGILSDNPYQKRTTLIALDQMENSSLKPESVAPLMASTEPVLRQAASWIAGHHPEWGNALAGFFLSRLETKDLSEAGRRELESQLAQFARSDAIQEVMASVLNDPAASSSARETVLRAMTTAALNESPAKWTAPVRSCLARGDDRLLHLAVATARVLSQAKTNAPNFSDALARIGFAEAHPADLRLEALAAIPDGLRSVQPEMLTFLFANLDAAKPVSTRSAAATVLSKANLSKEQLIAVADAIRTTGPLELNRLLAPFERSTDEEVGLRLVASLGESKSLASLRPDLFKAVLAKHSPSVQAKGNKLLASLDLDPAKQGGHIDELLAAAKNGDVRRGQTIFNSQKAACASCHAIGYMGGHVGPDLTSIGQVRTERDLLESIIYPSASFVRSYEPLTIHTRADEEYSGVIKKDGDDEIVLATGPDTEVRIARADVAEMRPGTISIMPAGLDQQLSRQELADLLAFLKGTKWGPQ